MFKNNYSDNKLFFIYFGILLLTNLFLFVFGALFYTPFKDLAVALTSKETAPLGVWLASGSLALFLGLIWLSVFIIFEAAKKGMIDLIHKK